VLICLAGWNQQQRHTIEYLREENRVLREQLGGWRLRLNNEQRRRLAAKAKGRARRLLAEIVTIVTPETLLVWYRELIVQNDGCDNRRHERPRTDSEIEASVVRMAEENRAKRHGLERSPERSRKTTWKEFLTRHWELIVAADFFTIEVWTRKVEIAGIGPAANGRWMSKITRNLTAADEGILSGKRYLHDSRPIVNS
jgi:putative transposase